MVIVSQLFLYIAFSILAGAFLFGLIPENKQPSVRVPRLLIVGCVVAIPILSFFPLLQVTLFFYEGMGFWQTFQSVVFTFEIGQAWLIIVGVSLLLFMSTVMPIRFSTKAMMGLVYLFVLILAVGWGSHGASIAGWTGMLVHSAHFSAVCVWVGCLLMVAWFSRDTTNWRSFLSWFHPLAISCVLVTVIAGIMLMFYGVTTDTYLLSWMMPYGQALLIKHLLVVPLIAYAFINGYVMKKRLNQEAEFNPRPWTRVESVVVFFIFAATAALGEAAPPHNPETLLSSSGPAWLFQLFHPEAGAENMGIAFQWSLTGISLLVMACLFIVLLLVSFIKKVPAAFSLLMGMLVVVSGYLALMLSIQV